MPGEVHFKMENDRASQPHSPSAVAFVAMTIAVAFWGAAFARPARAGVLEGSCRVANQPAATLLFPYFEVDLSDPMGRTTLLSINNASSRSTLSRVVVWTDWGVPTLAFDLFLTGYDVQTLNVRDLFQGKLPRSGPQSSPEGALSVDSNPFDTCAAAGEAGIAPPLDEEEKRLFVAAHSGVNVKAAGASPACASQLPAEPGLLTGYITVDTVRRCSPRRVLSIADTPVHGTYFADDDKGLATDDNILWGDYVYLYPREASADSQVAVAVPADPDFFHPGDYTFYGRYVGYDKRDHRAPLSSLYFSRFVDGGAMAGNTDLIVWRDTRRPDADPIPCGARPAWAPPGELQIVVFDEEENPTEILEPNAFPLATQRVHVGGASLPVANPYGWLMLDLWFRDATHAQAFVSVRMSSGGRFTAGHEALRVDDLCNFGL